MSLRACLHWDTVIHEMFNWSKQLTALLDTLDNHNLTDKWRLFECLITLVVWCLCYQNVCMLSFYIEVDFGGTFAFVAPATQLLINHADYCCVIFCLFSQLTLRWDLFKNIISKGQRRFEFLTKFLEMLCRFQLWASANVSPAVLISIHHSVSVDICRLFSAK